MYILIKHIYHANKKGIHGTVITNCICLHCGTAYAIPAIKIYDTATGNISNIPIIVRHFPLTSSTTSTKLTIVTPIDANPRIIRNTMNIGNDVENATRIPVCKYIYIYTNYKCYSAIDMQRSHGVATLNRIIF